MLKFFQTQNLQIAYIFRRIIFIFNISIFYIKGCQSIRQSIRPAILQRFRQTIGQTFRLIICQDIRQYKRVHRIVALAGAFGIGDEIPCLQRLTSIDNSLPRHLDCCADYRSRTLERHLPPSAVCAVDEEEVHRNRRRRKRLVLVLSPEPLHQYVEVHRSVIAHSVHLLLALLRIPFVMAAICSSMDCRPFLRDCLSQSSNSDLRNNSLLPGL